VDDHSAELLTLGRQLYEAERDRRPIDPISEGRPWLGLLEAYAVQQEVVRLRRADGDTIVGWKVGLTSQAMQQQLGVDEPDHGPMLSSYLVQASGSIAADALIAPRIESEIAFRLRSALRGPGVTAADVLAATDGVAPSFEVIDSRVADWRITIVDTIADLASSARVVVGDHFMPASALDLAGLEVSIKRNGELAASGLGSAVLGDPAKAVAWVANTLGRLGVTMEPGHIVIPGSVHAAVPAAAGDHFKASFGSLGDIEVSFT
jgi:2-oxopent-4-enoate hydratase